MCSMYWNLNTRIICPECRKKELWNLQTHFMGDYGSCINNYKLKENIPELKKVSVILDGRIDDFIGDCSNCGKFYDFGAEIIEGKVMKVWILNKKLKGKAIDGYYFYNRVV